MSLIYKELAQASLESMQKEEALLFLCEYLQEKLMIDKIICFASDRRALLHTVFIEYAVNGDRYKQLSFKMDQFLPLKVLEEYFGKDFNQIFISSKDSIASNVRFTLGQFLPRNCLSALTFCAYRNSKKDYQIFVSCFSEEDRIFSFEQIDIVKRVRPFFEKIVVELYQSNPKASLFFTPTGPLPTSFEEQLRACPCLKDTIRRIETVAPYDSTVLISGPTGSGKELVAESIHILSPRFKNPFVRVNCGAIPESLIESELFGYEKGAFTGAVQMRKGYFEQANNGTIYLDEIGELSKSAQTRLLRVLESREIQRVGSERAIKLDIRIVAASHRNLLLMSKKDLFREDLYYRLNIFPIVVPALAQRREDIPVLLDYFYKLYVQKLQLEDIPRITYKLLRQLTEYTWPGNVRQLKHAVERALLEALAQRSKDLNFDFLQESTFVPQKYTGKKIYTMEEIEKALQATKGKIQGKNGAAALLGLHPATLRSRMQVLGIPFAKAQKKEKL